MDSDEEEMAAMRNSSRYGGGRKPARTEEPKETPLPSKGGGGRMGSVAEDSDGEQEASSIARQGRSQQRTSIDAAMAKMLGPVRPSDDSDPAMSVDEGGAPDEEMGDMRDFLPVSFGRGSGKKNSNINMQAHDALKRNDPKAAIEKKSGVQFGPRVMEAAAAVGAASRRAQKSAKALAEAEAKARAEEQMQVDDDSKSKAPTEDADMYGLDAPPAPGTEHEVLPLSHEVVIPALEKVCTAISLDPKGSRMIAAGTAGQMSFYDFNGMSEAKESFRRLEPTDGHMVVAVSFSTTGGCCLVVCNDWSARIYDRDGSSKPIQATNKGDMYVRDMSQTQGHTQMLTDGVWHPFSADNFLTSSLDGTLRIWDMRAKPVGMDQVLPSIHVLKILDKRNVCIGGASGRSGGLYPACCAYSPNGSLIAGGCSDGSIQVFFEKARYQKPDRILRVAHKALVTCIAFLGDGVGGNKMISRSMDNTMKLWDCKILNDAKGPMHVWDDLPCELEKTAVCSSPDGKYIVTGTSFQKGSKANASLRVYSSEDFALVKSLDFGQKSIVAIVWQREINQVIVGTSIGDVVMLYSPYSSKKGALHFVGKHKRVKAAHELEDSMMGPIFNMTEPKDCAKFYSLQTSKLPIMQTIRRQEARVTQKTITPARPPELDNKTATTAGTKLVSKVILQTEGRSNIHDQDAQQVLLAYGKKTEEDPVYFKTYDNNPKILDYSMPEGEGDKKMQGALSGDFCRKCGMKMCRCVDYSQWGDANPQNKKQKIWS